MLSNNIIKISAAGSGKTWDICNDALTITKDGSKKVLITTYTNRGAASIRKEIKNQNCGVLSKNIIIKTWYEFLMAELIKPYQNSLNGVSINEIKTFDFSNMYGKVNYAKKGTKQRYLTTKSLVKANEASNLSLLLNELSHGRVINRLEKVYNRIYFDEIQDLSGADIDLLELLIKSKIDIICCGDNKQATYSTHNAKKNKKFTGANIWVFFEALNKKRLVTIEKNLNTRRFNNQICAFANSVFPVGDSISTIMNEVTDHDGVYIISKADVECYCKHFMPQVLRFDAKTDVGSLRAVNFGACKGETFDRVLIFLNGPFEKFILKGEAFNAPEKYYVAVTRPRYSIALVMDKLPKKVADFKRDTIAIEESQIECYKYQLYE